jgi:hypothetical protein
MLAATLAWSAVARVGHNDELRRRMMMLNCLGWSVLASSVLAAFAPAALAEHGEYDERGQIKNGLSSTAFRRNALTTNEKAIEILRKYPLNDDVFQVEGGYIGRQLLDPKARAVFEEVVECALDASTKLHHAGTASQASTSWKGNLGLCQSWHQGPPDKDCQERVTACLMARVNTQGKAIPLSLRSVFSPPRDPVSTGTRFRESPPGEDPSEGWLIGSFSDGKCAPGQDCNWAPAYVGKCDSGEIQLAIQGPACSSVKLRVCAGIHGCLGPDSGHELPADFPRPSHAYSKHLKDKQGACADSPLRFECPVEVPIGGYYSVMTFSPQNDLKAPVIEQIGGLGTYPATEEQVFSSPEGGFYGNLFDSTKLRRSCEVNESGTRLVCTAANASGEQDCETGIGDDGCSKKDDPLPNDNVFACYSFASQKDAQEAKDEESLSVAALNHRFCNSPDPAASCFRTPPQRCRYTDPTASNPNAGCELMGNGSIGNCKSPVDNSVYKWVIATHLNDVCSLVLDDGLCTAMRRRTLTRKDVVPPQRGCGRCSADARDGALPSVPTAALVALLVFRRRRRAG